MGSIFRVVPIFMSMFIISNCPCTNRETTHTNQPHACPGLFCCWSPFTSIIPSRPGPRPHSPSAHTRARSWEGKEPECSDQSFPEPLSCPFCFTLIHCSLKNSQIRRHRAQLREPQFAHLWNGENDYCPPHCSQTCSSDDARCPLQNPPNKDMLSSCTNWESSYWQQMTVSQAGLGPSQMKNL